MAYQNMKDTATAIGSMLLMVFIVALFVGGDLWFAAAVPKSVAVTCLETQGFSNVTVLDKDITFISCQGGGEHDKVLFKCEATNPAGKRVKVDVFSGAGCMFQKGATIRTK